MAVAALGWGVYSLRGRVVKRPLAASASAFLLATPLALGLWLVFPDGVEISPQGVGLAIASGAIASGLGYALWYTVLPQIRSSTAAVLQLSVPIIALAGGDVAAFRATHTLIPDGRTAYYHRRVGGNSPLKPERRRFFTLRQKSACEPWLFLARRRAVLP